MNQFTASLKRSWENSLKWDKVSIKFSKYFFFKHVLFPISFILLGKKLKPES